MTRSRSQSRSEPGVYGPFEPEPLEKKNQEPEPLKNFAGSPALVSIINEDTFLWLPINSIIKIIKQFV